MNKFINPFDINGNPEYYTMFEVLENLYGIKSVIPVYLDALPTAFVANEV